MKKLPKLALIMGLSVAGGSIPAVAAWGDSCQDCIPEDDGSGQMCWSGAGPSGEYGACWEEVIYDEEGNEVWDYCTGSPCTYAE